MTQDEALQCVLTQWLAIAEESEKCKLMVDESSIVEYEWGWVFALSPAEDCQPYDTDILYACERRFGISTPIGFLGVGRAADLLQSAARNFETAARATKINGVDTSMPNHAIQPTRESKAD